MSNAREDINHYLALWDAAQKQFPKEKKPAPKDISFYGMSNIPDDSDFSEEEEEHWRDVYYRSLEIDTEELLTDQVNEEEIDQQCLAGMMDIKEAKAAKAKKKEVKKKKPKEDEVPDYEEDEDGFGKDLAKKLGGAKFNVNPTHFASVGDDSKLRVTPNFTDGDDLRKLAKLKSLLYDLESQLLGTDVRGGDPEPLRIKMIAIQRQCEALSQSLTPDPRTDVS